MTANLTEAFYARLHAFYTPTEEFYRKDQLRDAHGRWTRGRKAATAKGTQTEPLTPTRNKAWSGISAHPTDRIKPTPSSELKDAFRIENDWRSNEALAKRIYDADLGGGFHSSVVEVEPAGDYRNPVMSVRGVLMKGTREVGTFERTIGQDENGIVVSHDELLINGSQQSKGVGDRFNAHAIAEYQRIGVDRIVLHAGDTVGGYAWARQGFRFDEGEGNEYRLKFLNERLKQVEAQIKYNPTLQPHKAELTKQVGALRKAIEAGEDVQPIHLASLGEKYKFNVYDDNSNEYTTWPGKQALLGSRWNGVYYFDAAHPVTAAAMSLEHADLRPAFRDAVEEFFDKSQPRDKNGMWTVGVQHVASRANAEAIARDGFKIDAVDKWDQSFGPGLYFAEEGDVKSAKFYARQGSGRDTHSSQVISAELSLRNPAHFDIRTHADFRQQATTTLGGREKLVELAQAKYDEAVKVTRQAFTSELKKDNPDAFSQLDLKHPEQAFLWDFSQGAVDRAVNKIKSKTGLSLDQIGDWKALAERPEDVLRSGPTASDNWTHQSANIGILLRDAGYDGIVLNTRNWGGIGGTQVVVFNPSSVKVKSVRPYGRAKSIQAAAMEHFEKQEEPCTHETSAHHLEDQDSSSSPVVVCSASILPSRTMTTLVRSWSQRPTASD